jgi:hypothetical protein
MKVEVRPIVTKKWHGKEGKDDFSQPKAIEALYDKESGRLATGLTDAEAEEYGKLLGVDLSNKFNASEAHPFYSQKQAWVFLPNHTVIFDTDKPMDFVKVKMLKASKMVANSQRELAEGSWPEATHVIFDETEEVALKAGKVQLRQEAYKVLLDMTTEDKVNIIQILSEKSVRGRSQNFVDVEIDDIIENKTQEFLKYANMGREEVTLRATILEALQKQILTKEGSTILYMGEVLGYSYEDTIGWFRQPDNQKRKIAILEKLNK